MPIIACCLIGSHSLLIDHEVSLISPIEERAADDYGAMCFICPHTAFNFSKRVGDTKWAG